MRSYDIVIVGGGPSGLTFARLISKKYRVLLIEKRDFSKTYGKPCGGLIAPDAQLEISRQKLSLPVTVLATPQLFNVQVIDVQAKLLNYYPRHYINVDRMKFDVFLKEMIQDVEIEDLTTLKAIKQNETGYLLEIKNPKNNETIKCTYLIGADGAQSVIRKQVIKKNLLEKYICVQEWFETTVMHTSYGAIFDKNITDYYAWYIQKDHELLLGAALKQKDDVGKKFERLKKQFQLKNQEFHTYIRKEGQLLSRPKRLKDIQFGKDHVFLIGEASGLVSPSSGEGISYALQSGRVLAEVFNLEKANKVKTYKRKMFKTKVRVIFKRFKGIVIYHNWIRKIVMRLHLTAIKDVKNRKNMKVE